MDSRKAWWLCYTALVYSLSANGQNNMCRPDEYFVDGTGECVIECPCGTFANIDRHCIEDDDLFFNMTQFNFKLSAADISDTPLVSTVLYIDQTLLNDGSTFGISLIGPHLDVIFFFLPSTTTGNTLRLNVNNSSSTGSNFHGQRFNVTDDLMRCTYKTKTFVTVPVQVYAVMFSGKFSLSLLASQANKFLSTYTYLDGRGEIDNGCSGKLVYLFSTGQCVESCPCGMYNSYGSCQSNLPLAFEASQQTVRVTPSTVANSTLATVTLLIDTALLTDDKLIPTSSLTVFEYAGAVRHNNSGDIDPHFGSNVRPLFRMDVKANASISGGSFLRFDSYNIRQLRDTYPVECAANNSKSYLAVPVDLVLQSDSFYHLGDHPIYLTARLDVNGSYNTFFLILSFKVEAECFGSLDLYDFTIHRCVSQCTCGYSPFHSHTTSYCEAVEYGPSEFTNDRASLFVTSLPTRSFVNLYVNLDSFYFFAFGSRNTIIARLEITLNFSKSNPPQVSFVQPDGTLDSSVEIVLDSSIDFRYCYDRLRNKSHTLYQVPIHIATSFEGETVSGENRFRVQLSHYSPQNPILTDRLRLFRNDSLDLYVNYSFVERPGGVSAVAVGVPVGVVGGVALIAAVVAVIAVIVCILVRGRQKVGQFAQFTNDDKENVYFTESEGHIYDTVSSEEVDSITKSPATEENEEHNGLENPAGTD